MRHLVERGEELEVCSNWPDVFLPLAGRVKLSAFRRDVDIRAHYAMRKGISGTDQFQDVCIAAGAPRDTPFILGWSPRNMELVRRVRAGGRPVIAVQLPRAPFDRKDGFGTELLPDCNVIQAIIDTIGDRAKFVLLGKGDPPYRFTGIDLDLSNNTSVSDLLDATHAADAFLGYVSFFVPLAESQAKPALFVWSRAGLESRHEFIRQITPQKIFHRAATQFVIDDSPVEAIAAAASELYRQAGRAPPVLCETGRDRRLRAGGAR